MNRIGLLNGIALLMMSVWIGDAVGFLLVMLAGFARIGLEFALDIELFGRPHF